MLAAGADLDHVRDLPASDTLGLLDVKRDVKHLRELVRDGDFPVVVFDALLDNLPDGIDEYKPRQVRAALRPLGRLARDERFAALGSLHTNKGGETFRQKMSGSHAFNALARSGLLLAYHPQDFELPEEERRRVLARGKGNLSKRPPSVEFSIASTLVEVNDYRLDMSRATGVADSDLGVEDLLAPPERGSSALDAACEFLHEELKDGSVRTKELQKSANDAGVSWRSIERARDERGIAHTLKIGDAWHWELANSPRSPPRRNVAEMAEMALRMTPSSPPSPPSPPALRMAELMADLP